MHIDSIHSLTYNYNPALLMLTLMGGIIGATGNDNILDPDRTDHVRWDGVLIGTVVGAGFAYVLGNTFGKEKVILDGIEHNMKKEVIRARVAHWTGQVAVIEKK